MVVAERLHKRFGEQTVVDDVSFAVHAGEIFGLIGPHGAGKTTTFRIVAGLIKPTAGVARVAGHDVALEPEAAKARIGLSTGSAGLYGRLTVREQLEYFGDLHRVEARLLRRRIDEVGALLDLGRFFDRRCEKLST